MNALLTGRELVGMLSQLGVGSWTPESVRQWIREEPPCPIADHADQGKPHRYEPLSVLQWLTRRTLAERAKGFTRGGASSDLVERLDAAIKQIESGSYTEQPQVAVAGGEKKSRFTATPPGGSRAEPVSPSVAAPQAPAQAETSRPLLSPDPTKLNDVDWLLEILSGRDPSNYNKTEQGLKLRRERLLLERRMIMVDELEIALTANTEHVLTNLRTAVSKLKSGLGELLDASSRIEAERIVDSTFDWLFDRLASTDDIDSLPQADVQNVLDLSGDPL